MTTTAIIKRGDSDIFFDTGKQNRLTYSSTGKKNSVIKNKSKNPAVTGIPPRGYVTLEQFAEEAKKIINDYCDTHDIH